MGTKRMISRILVLVMVVCMLSGLAVPAFATANEKITDAKNAVVQLQLWFKADKWAIEEHLSSGTGFFINEDHVVTCWHVIDYATESVAAVDVMKYIANKYGIVYTPDEIMENIQIRVQILRDVYVEAEVRASSLEMDYAVLKLEDKLHNRGTLPIRSSSDLKQTESVYALGFPGDMSQWTDQDYYDADDVTITSGSVNKVGSFSWSYADGSQHRNVDAVETSAMITGGNSGGPLVDANGAVVGINAAGSDIDGSVRNVAVASDQLIATLDALGIEYEKAGTPPAPPVVTDPPVVETPVVAPTEAPSLVTPETPSVPVVNDYENAPAAKGDQEGDMTIILIVAAVAVLAVIVVVIVVLSGKKKKAAPAPAAPAFAPAAPAAPAQYNNGGFKPAAPTPAYTAPMDAGETSVLSQSAGETTVLNRNVNGGTLVRKRTGESVSINAETFVIGRERKTVNYCIADNTSISRSHVTLRVRGNTTYLTDMNAANGTFVNGVKVMPRQEVALKNGDKITLADEDFEFRA